MPCCGLEVVVGPAGCALEAAAAAAAPNCLALGGLDGVVIALLDDVGGSGTDV